jgi:hypothetical protein
MRFVLSEVKQEQPELVQYHENRGMPPVPASPEEVDDVIKKIPS